jgi:hypothetical protein
MAEGFSGNLDVLHGGLGMSELLFLTKKIIFNFLSAAKFFQLSVIKTLDPEPNPDPQVEKTLDPH